VEVRIAEFGTRLGTRFHERRATCVLSVLVESDDRASQGDMLSPVAGLTLRRTVRGCRLCRRVRTRRRVDTGVGHGTVRDGASGSWARRERRQRRAATDGPLRSSRAGDRFALALISLALDEVDTTQAPDRRLTRSERRAQADAARAGRAPHRRKARPRAGHPVIAFAATRSPATAGSHDLYVAKAIARREKVGEPKRSRGPSNGTLEIGRKQNWRLNGSSWRASRWSH
jgi:hypothetical protein